MAETRPFPVNVLADNVSDQDKLNRSVILDGALATAEGSMLGHFVDAAAHPAIDTRFVPAAHLTDYNAHASNTFLRAHVDNAVRHVPAGSIAVPAPPTTGSFQLKSVDGVLSWVPF